MSASTPPKTSAENPTFGLSGDIRDQQLLEAINSINAEAIQQSLLLFTKTTRTWEHARRLATALLELSSPLAAAILSSWSTQNEDAAHLYAITKVPDEYTQFRNIDPLPLAQTARDHLKGQLQSEYLVALVLERIPRTSPDETRWLTILRLWLFVHATHRTRHTDCTQDSLVKAVADTLRKGCEKPGPWRDLLMELKFSAEDFDQLNTHLRHQPGRFKKTGTLTPSQQTFLSQLRRVASFEIATSPEPYPAPKLVSQELLTPPDNHFPGVLLVDEGNQSFGSLHEFTGDNFDPIAEIEIDPNQSPAQQEAHGQSVLTLSAEELHYLPWSASKITPNDQTWLEGWINQQLHSRDEKHKLLGACTHIAVATNRSLFQVSGIPINPSPQEEWTVIPNEACLQRKPPRRKSAWKAKTNEQQSWVTPIAEKISLDLPNAVRKALTVAISNDPTAVTIADLWLGKGENPEKLFRSLIPDELQRVTPGRLRGLLGQQLMNTHNDHVLARLLCSHPDSALPGSCAYPSWDLASTESALNSADNPRPAPASPINALGAELDPIELLLIQAVQRGAATVAMLRDGDNCITYHNALTTHLMWALMGATGGRFVKDPFDNPRHFDFEGKFVFIDDKASGKGREGRLVPLPEKLCTYLRDEYPKHLNLLAGLLAPEAPNLAAAIKNLLTGAPNQELPYFFLLRVTPVVTWASITPSYSVHSEVFECPLPAHMFRNRYANYLRSEGINSEVIEGYLGHQERGVATYGDYSVRCWLDDTREAKNAIEKIFDALPFFLPPTRATLPALPTIHAAEDLPNTPLFGSAAREFARISLFKATVRFVNDVIEELSQGTPLQDLTDDDLAKISQRLIFTQSGLPHNRAEQRYAIFIRKLEHVWRKSGKRVKMRRRYVWLKSDDSPFKATAPRALAQHLSIRAVLSKILQQNFPSRLPPKSCLALATIQFCVECRVTSTNLLCELLENRNYRLVVLKKTAWLEYSENLVPDDPDAPVQRYRIPHRTAKLFDRALSAKRSIGKSEQRIPDILSPLASLKGIDNNSSGPSDIRSLTSQIAEIVDQANVIEFPGLIAAYLGGRIQSTSLGWRDWLRLQHNVILNIPPHDEFSGKVSESNDLPFIRPYKANTNLAAMQSCRSFFYEFRAKIPRSYEETSYHSESQRIRLRNKLNAFIDSWSGRVCTTAILFATWIAQLSLKRLRSSQELRFFACNSMRRYLSALSPGIESFGYEIDLLSATIQETTELYTSLISRRGLKHEDHPAIVVQEFHRWAREFGISDPIWEDVPAAQKGRKVSPGFITEDEYLSSIRLLLNQPNVELDLRHDAAFLLLCCYRFALRNDDAIGLTSSDFQTIANRIQVHVHNNRTRRLKTGKSRRIVPLVFTLREEEAQLISEHLDLTQARYGDKTFSPLFSETSLRANWRLQSAVNAALKFATGNPKTTLHHARHTAANRLMPALYAAQLPSWWRLSDDSDEHRSRINTIIMSREAGGRSASWGLGGHLGHAGPYSSVTNYLHCIGDWATELINVGDESGAKYQHAVFLHDLDSEKKRKTKSLKKNLTTPFEAPTPSSALRFLRLIARGLTPERAGHALNFDPALCTELDEIIRKIGMHQKIAVDGGSDSTLHPYDFLRNIKDKSWSRLIDEVHAIRKTPPSSLPITIADLLLMISAQRQIVMSSKEQLASIAKILEYYSLRSEDYAILHRPMDGDASALQWATEYGFSPIEMNYEKGATTSVGKRIVRLDVIKHGPFDIKRGLHLVQLNFQSNLVKSSYDLVVLIIAAVSSGASTNTIGAALDYDLR